MKQLPRVPFTDATRIARCSSGQRWSKWGKEKLVTGDMISKFSDLTDNYQWIHEDTDRCYIESPYGKRIAHGLLLQSLIPALLPQERFVITGNIVQIIRGFDSVRYTSPVFPEDVVHVRVRNLHAYTPSSGKGTVVERDVELWSLTGKKPAIVCTLNLQYF